jgi:hypothetical protein
MLLLLPFDLLFGLWDLSIYVIAILNDNIGMISGVINLLVPFLLLSVKIILIFSFKILNSIGLRFDPASPLMNVIIVILLLNFKFMSLFIIVFFSDDFVLFVSNLIL